MHIINGNVYVGTNLLKNSELFTDILTSSRLLIITDQYISDLYLPMLLSALAGHRIDTLILPTSEANKNWVLVEKILATLTQLQHDRSSTVISLGGGVIGDLAGFAAAIYMRGTNWLQIPTTLLAQVDAAIGGKTGCNYLGQKNLLGCFYQPKAVVSDLAVLQTLSEREYLAGLAEVVKYGIACDAVFFNWLEEHVLLLKNRDLAALEYVIVRCCEIKLKLVALDETDRGPRLALNFGHTFGHALEAASMFELYLHGEAVAIGMLLATRLAVKLNLVMPEVLNRLHNLLQRLALPLQWQQNSHKLSEVVDCMAADKKKHAGQLRLILPCALGEVRVIQGLDFKCLEELIEDYAST